jgi:eukaryotic-like serine/threonine-protein kinase
MSAHEKCHCPEPIELERLLENSTPSGADTDIVRHLDECPDCQQQLEKLAVRESQVVELVEHIDRDRPDSKSAYWPAMNAVRETPSGANSVTEFPVPKSSQQRSNEDLSFLEPSEDSAYLGRLGHFEVARVIGRGGMGIVFEAYDSHLQRTVAVKVLDPDLADDELARQRFCREARAAAAITHEHVVTVYQVEKSGDGTLPFLVMQLIHGETLEKRITRDGPLPLPAILRIGMQVSAGLAAAHSLGMIHRDVKPGNILLEEAGGRVKLTDFGLARCIEDLKITRTGFVAGTPLYMSPEQALGGDIDERSDLFSLGAVLYEMSTGQPPFSGNTPLAVLKQITDSTAKSVRTLNPELPNWLNDLIQKLLAKRPDERPISASVVAQTLAERLAVFEPISPVQIPAVHTSGACETVKRQHRRHRMQSLLAGIGIGAALAIAAAIPFLGRRSSETAGPIGPEAVATLAGNAGPVWSISVTPDGKRLAMGIDDGTVKLWDVGNRRLDSTMNVHPGPVWTTSISSDGSLLVTGHDDGTVHVWDLATEKESSSFKADGPVRSLEFAPFGHQVAVGTRTGQVGIWNADTGERIVAMDGHQGIVMDVSFSPDGTLLGTASGDKTARIWNVDTGRERMRLDGHTGGINGISFSADNQLIATGGWDKVVRVWDTASGSLKGALEGHTADIWAVAFSHQGNLLASAGEDKEVRLWDASTLRPFPTEVGHTGMLCTLAFGPDGELVSAGRDGTARLWNVKALQTGSQR